MSILFIYYTVCCFIKHIFVINVLTNFSYLSLCTCGGLNVRDCHGGAYIASLDVDYGDDHYALTWGSDGR
jgi:hypothetical protein